MSVQIQLKGWKAIVILLAFAGAWGYLHVRKQATLETEAVEAVKPWIVAACMRDALGNVKDRPLDQLTQEEIQTLNRKIKAASRVEIQSIKSRGLGEKVVVRAEVLVDGKPPRDGKTVRYYSMRYSTLLGWTYQQEVDAISYWLALL